MAIQAFNDLVLKSTGSGKSDAAVARWVVPDQKVVTFVNGVKCFKSLLMHF